MTFERKQDKIVHVHRTTVFGRYTMTKKYLLVEADVLPEIFQKVLEAKALISQNKAKNTSEALRMVGISRGAYYKYKDSVFPYRSAESSILTVQAVLSDNPGVLMAFVSVFYSFGANILTINQNIPADGFAMVSVSARIDAMIRPLEELLLELGKVDGVRSVSSVSDH